MSAQKFMVTNGVLGLEPVNTAAVGYLPEWQAPGGKDIGAVSMSDYPDAAGFSCQVVTAVLEPTPNETTRNDDQTLCEAAAPAPVVVVGEPSFVLSVDMYTDPNQPDGLASFLFEHRTKPCYVYFGANGDAVPSALIGVVTVQPSALYGGAKDPNRATLSLPFQRTPDVVTGTPTGWKIMYGDHTASESGTTWPPVVA